ncbi:MAG: glycosyltransferase [Chitinispirillaceae bacterium]|nr:glycosyltransferase [Chitinispirillaceae bacterium]
MLISGFTFARNVDKLGYPVSESIRSILPICDEFIIALGKGDSDDSTEKIIEEINEPKIKIINTEWKDLDKLRGSIYSQQTNLALSNCKGKWCFYLQADEVVHEKYLPEIINACEYFLNNHKVDGFLFKYKHFWGDYNHYIISHKWYQREIRIIRNHKDIISIGDAQSFKYKNGKKIPAVQLDAEIFHYGYVRDPRKILTRISTIEKIYHGSGTKIPQENMEYYDYGSLAKLPVYSGEHPAVMKERIKKMDWAHLLQYSGKSKTKHPHERMIYKILTFIEQKIFRGSGREFWGYKPYKILYGLSREYRKVRTK